MYYSLCTVESPREYIGMLCLVKFQPVCSWAPRQHSKTPLTRVGCDRALPVTKKLNTHTYCMQPRVHNPQSVQRLIQLCIGSWSSVIGSSDVIIPHTSEGNPGSRGYSRIKNTGALPCAGVECKHDIRRSDSARPRPYTELDRSCTLWGVVYS